MDLVTSLLSGSVGAAVVAGVFGIVMYLMQRRDKRDEKQGDKKDAERKALCYVMLYIIEERAKEILATERITLAELRRLHHWHKVYKALGGNGDADSLMKRLEALSIVDE